MTINSLNTRLPRAVASSFSWAGGSLLPWGFFYFMEHYKNLSLEDLPGEEWRPIKDYEGLYEISSFGRVKSLSKRLGSRNRKNPIILSQGLDKYGYPQILLSKNGIANTAKVHRLVANAFIPNLENKPTVNHKLGVKTDNRASELEWFTLSEQIKHSYVVLKRELSPRSFKRGKDHKMSKPVIQYTREGVFIKKYASVREAQRETGIDRCVIMNVCRKIGFYKTAGGFKWEYETNIK